MVLMAASDHLSDDQFEHYITADQQNEAALAWQHGQDHKDHSKVFGEVRNSCPGCQRLFGLRASG